MAAAAQLEPVSGNQMPAPFEYDERFYTRLRNRTAVGGAVIFLIPFLLFILVVQFASERYVRRQFEERLRAGVAANAVLLDDVLALRLTEVRSFALFIAEKPLRDRAAALRGFVRGHAWYGLVAIADAQGRVLSASSDLRGRVDDCGCLAEALAGRAVLTDLRSSSLTGRDEIFIAVRLDGPVSPQVVVATLRLEKVADRLLPIGVASQEDSFLVNPGGQFVSPTRQNRRPRRGSAFPPSEPNPFQADAGLAEYDDSTGQGVLAAYQRLSRHNYFLVAQVPLAEMLAPVRRLRAEVTLYVLPFLVLGLLLAYFAWRYALSYIQRLMSRLYQALQVARQRERERDRANQELAKRFDEERKLAREKARFQTQLAEYEKYAALAQLALGAAHEINNPLLGILSHLELELRAAKDPPVQSEIQQCIEGARRIASTLRSLINYARPGPLQLSQVNLQRIVNETFVFLRHQPLFRNVRLEGRVPGDLPALTADTNQLSQVLMNLLLNSAQAMPQGGEIVVSAAATPGEAVEILVADTGEGIPADVLPHIFEPFFTTKRAKGTGLGLSITQAFIRSHGGEVSVASASGRGTTVRITLPLHQRTEPELQEQEVIG